MVFSWPVHFFQTRIMAAFPTPQTGILLRAVLLLAVLVLAGLLACTSESGKLGQYKKGRTLHLSVVSLERTPELRYSTCDALAGSDPPVSDPAGKGRNWSITASTEGMELVLVRARVENHTAVNAIINVDRTGAELRDFGNGIYRPLSISESAWRDVRGEPEALVRMDLGQCFDGTRTMIDAGSTVRWQSESEDYQYLDFDGQAPSPLSAEPAEVAPGDSLTLNFDQPGKYRYMCGDDQTLEFPAELRVAEREVSSDYIKRTTTFLLGSFELLQGHGLDGYLIFEAPIDTKFRDIRWRAGDSIIFDF